MKRIIDVQPGGEVHRLAPGCPEERVLDGYKVTPEYVAALAVALGAIQDPAAQQFARLVMEIILSRKATDEVAS